MSMEFSGLIRVFTVMVILFGVVGIVKSEGEGEDKNYITWDDMQVDGVGIWMSLRERFYNGSRIIVVDKKGVGNSVTVQGAVDMVPEFNTVRVKIYILPGIYREKVYVPRTKPYISFIGDQNRINETVITWSDKASDKDSLGNELGTFRSASVTVESDYFCSSGITYENTVVANPQETGMQAVALKISGDKAMFYRVRVLGTQDTLLDDCGTHYFFQSYIQGTVDFIFGNARSLYRSCVLHSIAPEYGAIAAHHRDTPDEDTGFSFVSCIINGSGENFLGRAWGNYSRVTYSYCYIDNIISPEGWSDWNIAARQKTAVFGEYHCRGRGANRGGRAPWSKSLSDEEAKSFMDMKFIDAEQWLKL